MFTMMLRSYLRMTRSATTMQAAASTSTITITATPASRPGSGDILSPGSADGHGLVPGSGDGVGPGPVNEHVKHTEVGNSTAAEGLCGPAVIGFCAGLGINYAVCSHADHIYLVALVEVVLPL